MRPSLLQLEPSPRERITVDFLPGARPAFVWLHAFGGARVGEHSSALFEHAAATGRAAARFDFRGHGDSTGTIGATTLKDLVADTRSVLAATGPAILVGHSLGGLVAALAAAEFPTLVKALVLLAPSLGYRHVLRRCIGPDGLLRTLDGRAFTVRPETLADADAIDEARLPHRLPMPVLVVHGANDPIIDPAASRAFTAAIPHAHKDHLLWPGADHRLSGALLPVLAHFERHLRA